MRGAQLLQLLRVPGTIHLHDDVCVSDATARSPVSPVRRRSIVEGPFFVFIEFNDARNVAIVDQERPVWLRSGWCRRASHPSCVRHQHSHGLRVIFEECSLGPGRRDDVAPGVELASGRDQR